ncbi:MFS transporter [Streptomyces coelicoflavus]|uniref:MFS transporter n=1 Tax=Streptomyces coelicoflavus TaxID=285562 RepID=A0A6N9UG01_9ACTN|nr:MFS transporter [Streptomyces coelicoflavus]
MWPLSHRWGGSGRLGSAGAGRNFEVLVTGRALQGLFGALLAPAALSLLTTTFTDAKERAKAFGIFGAIAGSGAAVGLLLGGLLTEYLNWRWTLYVNPIIAVVAIVGGWLLLERTERDRGAKLDIPGTVLVTAGLFGIVYGFSNAESHDWSSPLSWGFLAAGAALLAVFAWWQTRAAHPLLPLRVLLDRNRGAAFAALLVASAGMFGVFLFLTYYLQLTLGFSAIQTGLAFLPMVDTLMVSATMSTTFLLSFVGPKIVVPLGTALGAVGLFWLTTLGLDSSYAANVLPPLLVTGLGIGLVMAPSMSVGTSGVATEDAGVASASLNTMQQIGNSIGTPLLNTLAASAATSYLVGGRNPADKLVQAQAAMDSYTTAFMWSALLFAAGALITALLFRRGIATADPDAAPTVHM